MFLSSIGLGRARFVVLAVDDSPSVRRNVSHIRHLYPHLPLAARVHDLGEAAQVEAMGATFAFPEAVEAGLQFGQKMLEQAGVTADKAESLIEAVRRNDYELIRAIPDGQVARSERLTEK